MKAKYPIYEVLPDKRGIFTFDWTEGRVVYCDYCGKDIKEGDEVDIFSSRSTMQEAHEIGLTTHTIVSYAHIHDERYEDIIDR